jgi:hypothetical protein
MPGGESYRPGDIIKLFSGKTAEILNTDAEGRLILADALSYGEKQYAPKAIIDFATLTGACIVALGTNVAAIVSNDERLTKKINDSSKRTTEEVYRRSLGTSIKSRLYGYDKIRSCRYEKCRDWKSSWNYYRCGIFEKRYRKYSMDSHRHCRSCMDTRSYKRKIIQSKRSYRFWRKIDFGLFTKFIESIASTISIRCTNIGIPPTMFIHHVIQ